MALPSPWLICAHLPDFFYALNLGIFSYPAGEHLMTRAGLPETAFLPALKHCAIAFFEISCFFLVFISWEGTFAHARGCDLCFSGCLQVCSLSEGFFLMCQCLSLGHSTVAMPK